VAWIFLVMLGMIAGSVVVELILPLRVKERLGAAICWSMMAITMTFLGASTLGLLFVAWQNLIRPLLAG
jgi:hypothetical protein